MEAELENYEYQLSQVRLALEADPTNSELSSLQTELQEIISLTKQALGITGTAAASSSTVAGQGKGKGKEHGGAGKDGSAQGVKAGEGCSAKYKDGKWYPAKVTAVSGSAESPLYTVIFKGYTAPITLPSSSIRPLPAGSSAYTASSPTPESSVSGSKRKLTHEEEEREKEKKKKKNEKWTETMKERTQETLQKKSAWESFGKKAAKKGTKISGLTGKSIFRTPDNPTGKVGVVGSGQGVTAYEARNKHKFGGGTEGED